ncbi:MULTISPECIES: serine O-acetyltransferase [Flammeovirga]|uniref:Serine acetyltransferase n=1 Tax=Flammeovirga agarivorans TaxID=2726742 RepID=A0A7X8SHF0_9BACT|nr:MULTISPECIES: serine O-acetyltransferase [Flammeovirga]NLR90276.1 serine acetyltransferase [Flammeovirga agarivorans]
MDNINKDIIAQINEYKCMFQMPSKAKAEEFVDDLFRFLFPVVSGVEQGYYAAELALIRLKGKLQELFLPIRDQFEIGCTSATERFFDALPSIHAQLIKDAQAIFEGDPAAKHIEEVILAYPGFFAVFVHRLSHQLYNCQVPIVPRLFSEYAHSKTGIDIHPGATIGNNFCIDHGTGIVIGETCIIGNNVKIYQGVTLGALSVSKDLAKVKRHPTIENNVVIYSGTTILGGETVIGEHAIIGGNVWLTESVPAFAKVYNTASVSVRHKKEKAQ